MSLLKGKAALVANAGSAIGQAVVRRLTQDGAAVMGAGTAACPLDVADQASWEAALDRAIAALGRLDVLVTISTAAYATPRPIAETTLADFKAVTTANIEGAFLGLRFGIVRMRALGHGGAVVNVASSLATVGAPGQAAAGASANGIRMMTRAAALSCADAKDNIRVNAVLTDTKTDAPDDVAAAVAFLASGRASYITGAILPVGGGPSIV